MTARTIGAPASYRPHSVIPGFGLTLGLTVTYLSLVVLIPLAALFLKAASIGWGGFWQVVGEARVADALVTSFTAAGFAAAANAVFGTLLAWVLTRYRFPGSRLIDAMIDLPFALPTAVAGIALTTLYAPTGLFGAPLAALGLKVAFTRVGITLAMIFIGLPFVVRTLQPVLADLEVSLEEAAATLGAGRWITIRHVILPALIPALLTGVALAFARAVGEYGSIIFIAGNLPYKTEIAPLLIVIKLEEFKYPDAAAIAATMLILSFAILLALNMLQTWHRRRLGGG